MQEVKPRRPLKLPEKKAIIVNARPTLLTPKAKSGLTALHKEYLKKERMKKIQPTSSIELVDESTMAMAITPAMLELYSSSCTEGDDKEDIESDEHQRNYSKNKNVWSGK